MRPLFIAGCGRSGTTALTDYLNQHESVLVCIERYKYVPKQVTPDLFTFDRILDYREGETNISRKRHVRLLDNKYPEKLRWVGDKMPDYYKYLDRLLANNQGARFIFMYRPVEEVAESWEEVSKRNWPRSKNFERGVKVWNRSLRYVREFIESGLGPNNVLIVGYHDFFGGDEECISQLSRFLGLEFDNSVRETWEEISNRFEGHRRTKDHLNEEQLSFVRENKDRAAEEWVLDRIEQQREMSWSLADGPLALSVQQERIEELESRLAEERLKAQHLEARARKVEGQLQEIRNSNSWKLVRTINSAQDRVSSRVAALMKKGVHRK